MKVKVWNTILQLSKERGVATDIIVDAIKESLKVASQKYFTHDEDITVLFNPEKGELRVFSVKKIVKVPEDFSTQVSVKDAREIDPDVNLGDTIEIDLPSETLGRIAAQAAKLVIFRKVRDAEQEKIYKAYVSRLGEIVTAVVRRFESNRNMILELDRTEVLLPVRETLPNDQFIRGDRIKAVITHVYKETNGPQIIVSRTDNRFLSKLIELETPEISNGNIVIKDIVRQPGERAKVAVHSREKDIDPVGACIGLKGNRILSISQELGGEKIDVIRWSDILFEYAKAALNPARINGVTIYNKNDKILLARVPKDQLSLAIGKKGINVRLASILVGWKIEIKQE